MATKVGLVVIIATMIAALVNNWDACPWWMYWIVVIIAFVCLLINYISNRLVKNGWDLISQYNLDDELRQEVDNVINRIEMKMREQDQNKNNEEDKED